jgi:hypothetical protein
VGSLHLNGIWTSFHQRSSLALRDYCYALMFALTLLQTVESANARGRDADPPTRTCGQAACSVSTGARVQAAESRSLGQRRWSCGGQLHTSINPEIDMQTAGVRRCPSGGACERSPAVSLARAGSLIDLTQSLV